MQWLRRHLDALTVNFVAGLLLMGVLAAVSTGGLVAWSIVIDLPPSAIAAIGVGAFAATALLVNQGLGIARRLRDKALPWASMAQLAQPHLSRLSVRLVDLASDGLVQGRTFEDCDIYGPGVLFTEGIGILTACTFDAPKEAVFIEVSQPQLAGPLRVNDCVFRRCSLHNVGIIGPKNAIEEWKRRN